MYPAKFVSWRRSLSDSGCTMPHLSIENDEAEQRGTIVIQRGV